MANKGNGNKTSGTTGRKSTTAKNQTKQPIPINTPTSSGNVNPSNTPATQVYPGIEEEIRQRAYELYEGRGRQEGFHEEDWTRAETEILAKRRKESA